jgi:8-oxo-dGTP pyrophosphatase MutT (NUDIX family)
VADRVRRAGSPTAISSPSSVRNAVTVVLLRDASAGLEVYVMRRSSGLRSFGGMTVFPGGTTEPADFPEIPGERWIGHPPSWWAGPLSTEGDDDLARGLVRAAVRELFEETGVLLAGSGPEHVLSGTGTSVWEDARQAVEAGRMSLPALLAEHDLAVRADLLLPWAHWLTPVVEPRRYDTRFLIAEMPPGQATRHVEGEATFAEWIRPADLLARLEADEVVMVPPTAITLEELAEHRSVDSVMASAQARTVRRILPRLHATPDGTVWFLLPDDPGYSDDPGSGPAGGDR